VYRPRYELCIFNFRRVISGLILSISQRSALMTITRRLNMIGLLHCRVLVFA
jgi:hypothetical protein